MAYTSAQLIAAYTAANNGVAPDAATTALLNAFAAQTQTGQLADATALAYVINSAQDDVQVAVQAYQFFTGKTPTAAGLTYLTNSTDNATDLNDAYYAQFNLENRYINFAANLGLNGEGATGFANAYGAMGFGAFVDVIYETVIGSSYATAAGIDVAAAKADIAARYNNFVQLATERGMITAASTPAQVDLAVKASVVGYLMAEGAKADVGIYAAGANNFVNALINGNAQYNVDLLGTYSVLGGGTGSAVGGPPPSGATQYNLTVGVDNLTGSAGADVFNAGVAVNPGTGVADVETLTALDVINGGGGVDVLNYYTVGGTALPAAGISNVETINVISDGAVTADVSAIAGVTTVGGKAVAAAVDIDTKGNATSVVVTGSATTVAVDDNAAVDTLASVSITGNTGAATLKSDALTSLSLTNTDQSATNTAAAGTRVLTLGLNNVTGGTVTDATATGLVVNATGAASKNVTLTAVAATAVTINADEKLTIADVNLTAAKSITVTGDSAVTISATADVTALTSVSAAESSGGVTITPALGTGVAVTGGAGKDSVRIGATTKAVSMGGGSDTVTLDVAAVGAGGAVAGGDGTDTLAFTTFANAVTASADATFSKSVTGFEALRLNGANGVDGAIIDVAGLNGTSGNAINAVTFAATNTKDSVVNGLTSGATVTFAASQTAAEGVVVNLKNAAVGSTDVLNVAATAAAGLANIEVTAADVETVNLLMDDTATTPTKIAHAVSLTAAAVKTITVSGDAGVSLTNTATTVTEFNASGVTAGLVTWTTGALASAATITGGAGGNTINFSAATKAVTFTGGAGVDTVTTNNADNTVNTGAGADVVVLGSGKNTVDLGAGKDTVTTGTGLNTITLGADADIVNVTTPTSGQTYSTIMDFQAGDTLDFTGATDVDAFVSAKISLAGTAVFQDYLDAATAGNASNDVSWFQFGGDTYVVVDESANATFANGVDTVIKLVGLIDLSTATFSAANDTLTL